MACVEVFDNVPRPIWDACEMKHLYDLLKKTVNQWLEDKAPTLGAALAYYSLFSIAPLLIIAIGIAGMIFGPDAARGAIEAQMRDALGEPAAKGVQSMLENVHNSGQGVVATAIGIVVLFFGASGVFGQLQDALNTIWKVRPRQGRGILGVIKDRFLSFAMVLGVGFLLLVSMVITTALEALSRWWTPASLPGGPLLWQLTNWLVSFGVITLLFAMIFKVLPDVHIDWSEVWIGAAVTALLFALGKYVLGLYFAYSSTASAFGAAGSVVIVVVWVYYSSQILLLGASFTHIYACENGSPCRPTANAERIGAQPRGSGVPTPRATHLS
jgi:membrane protein